jgi:hypothetical protein
MFVTTTRGELHMSDDQREGQDRRPPLRNEEPGAEVEGHRRHLRTEEDAEGAVGERRPSPLQDDDGPEVEGHRRIG